MLTVLLDGGFRTPRTTITAFIHFLSVLDQNRECQWNDMIQGVEVLPDKGGSDLEVDADDELATFQLELHASGRERINHWILGKRLNESARRYRRTPFPFCWLAIRICLWPRRRLRRNGGGFSAYLVADPLCCGGRRAALVSRQ